MNKERLEELLELSECDLDSIEEFELLSGRSRLQARVLVELCPLEPDSSEILKQIVLETAIQESIHHHREKFTKRFSMVLNKLHEKETELLKKLYVAVHFFGGNTMFAIYEQNDLDLVHVGIASLRKISLGGSDHYSLVILERLSVEVIKNVLAEWNRMKEIRKRLNGTIPPVR